MNVTDYGIVQDGTALPYAAAIEEPFSSISPFEDKMTDRTCKVGINGFGRIGEVPGRSLLVALTDDQVVMSCEHRFFDETSKSKPSTILVHLYKM